MMCHFLLKTLHLNLNFILHLHHYYSSCGTQKWSPSNTINMSEFSSQDPIHKSHSHTHTHTHKSAIPGQPGEGWAVLPVHLGRGKFGRTELACARACVFVCVCPVHSPWGIVQCWRWGRIRKIYTGRHGNNEIPNILCHTCISTPTHGFRTDLVPTRAHTSAHTRSVPEECWRGLYRDFAVLQCACQIREPSPACLPAWWHTAEHIR